MPQIFNQLEVPFTAVNILEDERLRSGMKEYSQWPTFPQVGPVSERHLMPPLTLFQLPVLASGLSTLGLNHRPACMLACETAKSLCWSARSWSLMDHSSRSCRRQNSLLCIVSQVYVEGEFYGGCDILIGKSPDLFWCRSSCWSAHHVSDFLAS